MHFADFQKGALRTESPGVAYDTRMLNPQLVQKILIVLGHIHAAGEAANMAKRHLYYGKPWPVDLPVHLPGPPVCQAVMQPQFKRMLHAVLGKASELAELVEILTWMTMNGGTLKPVPEGQATAEMLKFTAGHVGEEFGDDKWYDAILADAAGFDPDTYMERVLAKLKARYPDAFTEEAAGTRDLDAEAKALAGGV